MDIRLSPDTEQRLRESIRRFVAEEYGWWKAGGTRAVARKPASRR